MLIKYNRDVVIGKILLIGWNPPQNGYIKLDSYGYCKENEIVNCGGTV